MSELLTGSALSSLVCQEILRLLIVQKLTDCFSVATDLTPTASDGKIEVTSLSWYKSLMNSLWKVFTLNIALLAVVRLKKLLLLLRRIGIAHTEH